MSDRSDYFFEQFDNLLAGGRDPVDALNTTAKSYARVFRKEPNAVIDALDLTHELFGDEELKDTKVGRIGSRIVGFLGRLLGRK